MAAYRIVLTGLLALLLAGCGANAGGAPTSAPNVTAPQPSATAAQALPTSSTPADTPVASPTSQPAAPTATAPAATAAAAATSTSAPAGSGGGGVTSLPDSSAYTWVQVASGIMRPTDITFLPGGSGDFLALSQPGVILKYQKNQALAAPFLDLTGKVGSAGNEQGLLGIALHPQFQKNGYFYINYTDKNGNTVIARYQVAANNPNQADPGSEKVLLQVNQPYPNHNGGSMVFGPDGYLYMGLGDGGSQGDPNGNGQRLDTYLAKILRVDVDHGDPYAVPESNPFAKGGGKPEIWAYGLRNPWRFSFDRLTGELYIADVGQDLWEEIDYLPANAPGGTNFGWNYREGRHPYRGSPPAGVKLTDPVYDYSHSYGCSVTGGFVYRGKALPAFQGVYLFADYCSGRVWGLLRDTQGAWQAQELFRDRWNITSFGQDNEGELYFLDQASGGVWKLQKK